MGYFAVLEHELVVGVLDRLVARLSPSLDHVLAPEEEDMCDKSTDLEVTRWSGQTCGVRRVSRDDVQQRTGRGSPRCTRPSSEASRSPPWLQTTPKSQ